MSWHRYRAPVLSREHSSPLAIRLAKKIKRDLNIECDPETFRRTYAGYWQKGLGAYLWTMRTKSTFIDVGSGEPASECVKSKYILEITDYGEICTKLKETVNDRSEGNDNKAV